MAVTLACSIQEGYCLEALHCLQYVACSPSGLLCGCILHRGRRGFKMYHVAVPVTPAECAGAYERLWAADAVSVDSKLGDDGETLQEVSTRIKQLFSVRKPPNL